MNSKKILFAAALGVATLGTQALELAPAAAQSSTTGAIRGIVKDSKTGEALIGVTVIATSPSLQGTQSAVTDENGFYLVTTLPPGVYTVSFYYSAATVNSTGVAVNANGTTTNNTSINPDAGQTEIITIKAKAPSIDVTTTQQGLKITKEILAKLPVPGRSFEGAALQAAGTRADGVGVSVSGSSSLENNYVVDGINTGSLALGTVGSPVINDFLEEIEVITGGYNAEYGRSTGGVISVVTKSGTNKFQGSVFAYLQPGALVGTRDRTPSQVSPINAEGNVGYNYNVGFELGGPIVKDKLWFYVGFAPTFVRTDINRTVNRRTDCRVVNPDGKLSECVVATKRPDGTQDNGNADGKADKDPATGLFITDRVDQETRTASGQAYSLIAKLNYAASSNQQGQLTLNATPQSAEGPNAFGAQTVNTKSTSLQTDVAGKWTSKFNNNKTEIEATLGWHREESESLAKDPAFADVPIQVLRGGSLARWADLGNESEKVRAGCRDTPVGGGDPYGLLPTNCEITTQAGYLLGGPGGLGRDLDERRSGKLSLTQRVKALGTHEFKAGGDIEINNLTTSRLISGGASIENIVSAQQVRVNRFVQLADAANTDPRYDGTCYLPNPDFTGAPGEKATLPQRCDYLSGIPGSPGTEISSETFNWSAYLRDSWQIKPNLTINGGLRYEEQRLRYAKNLQYGVDPITGEKLGKNAMTLNGMIAPRIGMVYDWTKEGKSKLYGNWGRFYQSIPMQINKRSFGGEVSLQQLFRYAGCPGADDPRIGAKNGESCIQDPNTRMAEIENFIGASGVLIAPHVKSQYLDETLVGAEYEIADDLKLGIAYSYRTLGRVLEDVSTDGANTYVIANPGEIADSDLDALASRINATDDATEKKRLQKQLDLFRGIKVFDTPRRDYHAITLTAVRRFSKRLYVQANYTYSQNKGNYPGLISFTNGQLDPNISSQYDLVELLSNRNGFLDQDIPHNAKFNGFYTFDFNKAGNLTLGATAQFASGTPYGALGGHYLYGQNESFLLPRGSVGRAAMDYRVNAQIAYDKKLSKGMTVEVFLQLFNLFNTQNEASVDDTYAIDTGNNASNPIVGGRYSDLVFAKAVKGDGSESATPLERNPNYGNTAGRYSPVSGRFGFRLTF